MAEARLPETSLQIQSTAKDLRIHCSESTKEIQDQLVAESRAQESQYDVPTKIQTTFEANSMEYASRKAQEQKGEECTQSQHS